ncbi:MAG: C40 family peptidase [Bacilli bacterium]|nr:C40 family peptidase [Bacilli bacterium]
MNESTKDVAKDIAKEAAKKKLLMVLAPYIPAIAIGCLVIFVLIVAVLFMLGLFDIDSNNGVGGNYSKECGFTISKTSLSKSEYKSKLEDYATTVNANFKIFAENADSIYDYAKSKNINPELVAVRAKVEGNGTTTGSYNYWGMGCTNGNGIGACFNYSSFEEGYTDYINNISQYSSLTEMMGRYAYIGEYWYNPGSSSDGGCYYAPYIYTVENMPARVKNACSNSAPYCSTAGGIGCTKTTAEDQNAYATWQIQNNMAGARKEIFGLDFEDGPCSSTTSNIQSLSEYNFYHNNLKVLDRKLTSSEVSELNNYIESQITKAGYGTGAAVAAAGQALTYWLENQGYYLQYRWGGGHGDSFLGVNPEWGSSAHGCDAAGLCYNGLDCSGFVSWAIRNGCNPSYGSNTTYYMKHGPAIDISKVEPGDLMLDLDSHVMLVVKNNGDGTVIVAEETGSPINGLVFSQQSPTAGYEFIDMTSYYQNNCSPRQ